MNSLGLLFALIAMFSWGFGDFLLQKSSRIAGVSQTIFINTLLGTVFLLPFVIHELSSIHWLLWLAGLALLLGSILDLSALKVQDISVIQPVFSVELPLTVLLGIVFAGETLQPISLLLIISIFLGIVLIGVDWSKKKTVLKRGVILALLAAIAMAFGNLLTGLSSQYSGAILTIWVINCTILLFTTTHILFNNALKDTWHNVKNYPGVLLGQALIDNVAWVAFAASMVLIPISIASAVSESYVAIAVILGIKINNERVTKLQFLGLILVVSSLILLSLLA